MRDLPKRMRNWLVLPIACACLGCGSSAPIAPPKASVAAATTPAKPIAAKPTPEKPAAEAAKPRRERSPQEKNKVAALFQIPEYSRSTNSSPGYPDARAGNNAPPSLRLLGFSRSGGDRQALVELKGEVLAVEQGDVVDGVEVVSIDDEGIHLQYFAYRWSPRLFEKQDPSARVIVKRAAQTAENVASKLPLTEIPVPVPPVEGGDP